MCGQDFGLHGGPDACPDRLWFRCIVRSDRAEQSAKNQWQRACSLVEPDWEADADPAIPADKPNASGAPASVSEERARQDLRLQLVVLLTTGQNEKAADMQNFPLCATTLLH